MGNSKKAVVISINPKWCGLIASGEKTLEIRKTAPKIKTPFKCYIYCTKDTKLKFWTNRKYSYADDHSHNLFDRCGNGKIIGEFICDNIENFSQWEYDYPSLLRHINLYAGTKGNYNFLDSYLNNKKCGYGWHISDLKIYAEPKEFTKRAPQSWMYTEEEQNE